MIIHATEHEQWDLSKHDYKKSEAFIANDDALPTDTLLVLWQYYRNNLDYENADRVRNRAKYFGIRLSYNPGWKYPYRAHYDTSKMRPRHTAT